MIRERLRWGFVLIALVPLLGVGVATSLVSYYNGRQQSVDRLESVAARKELAIRIWAQSLQRELQIASQTDYPPRFVSTALRLANEDTQYDWDNSLVRKRLQALLDHSSQFKELFLLDLRGRAVVSTDPAREGQVYGDAQEFRRGLTGPFTRLPFHSPIGASLAGSSIGGDQSTVVTTVPVRGNNGELLGVIGGFSGLEPLLAILDERTGLGETGRTYLVDGNHMLLADPGQRPPEEGWGDEEPRSVSTSGLDSAIRSATSISGIYAGSSGASVVGSSRWLPDLEVALSVEQHLSEALRAVFATLGIHVVIALAAVAIAVVAAMLMTRSIADPIATLAHTASQVATGNLDRTVKVERPDEIGALARSFNSMTAQLRDLINSLELRVEERTGAFQEANLALERRALQLETSARVARDITSILDIDDLLARVVDLIQEAFGYYHVQVFLLDKDATGRPSTVGPCRSGHWHAGCSQYSVVLLSEGWRRQLSTSIASAQPEAQRRRIGEIAQQALKEMRLLIHELRPPALDQESLVDALRKRFDAVENHVGVEGRVVMDDFVDLPSDVEDGLYRIAQEALNNALKHAQATREGELVIWSSPGAGTTVTVSVPLRNPIPPMGAEG